MMTSLVTNPSTDPLGSAVAWLQTMLLGTSATTVAVLAVASLGLLMLTGRVDLRRGVRVILGCFVLFGASAIAAGLHRAATAFPAGETAVVAPTRDTAPPPAYPDPAATPYDPYAGAAVAPRP